MLTVTVRAPSGPTDVTFTERGAGRPFMVLHGGAGPQSVEAFADQLADERHARVLVPTHPGFGGTPRPDALDSIGTLAALYAALLDTLDLTDVCVVGNSIGGWTAAELALLHSPRVNSVVLVDAVGLDLPENPVVDFFGLTMSQVTDLSYADPDAHRIDVDALPEQAKAAMAANRATLEVYGGAAMTDPTLLDRLSAIDVATLVVWGAADRIVPPQHGTAYAGRIPGARLTVLDDAGHLPQMETPARLLADVWSFADAHATNRPA